MKVLFVSSGNSSGGKNVVVHNQSRSLERSGLDVEHFTIQGKGLFSYLRHIKKLRRHIKDYPYDIIHAHYSFSAFTATLARVSPLIVSLMGSDIYSSPFFRLAIRFCSIHFWQVTIVKATEMKKRLSLRDCYIIPNGVDLEMFFHIERDLARSKLNLPKGKKYVLFASNPSRTEKNFSLARKAVERLNDSEVELLTASLVPHDQMILYYNASNVLLLTSQYEGSVNVVKEAMACGLPAVSTDVGDVRQNFGDTEGYYICHAEPEDLAKGLTKALKISSQTEGRERIKNLGLDSQDTANRIVDIYDKTRNRN
jgi:teichuronic acid biosynthesis glycosyltransferase TuaC